jgi:hypothetical protein
MRIKMEIRKGYGLQAVGCEGIQEYEIWDIGYWRRMRIRIRTKKLVAGGLGRVSYFSR